MTTYQLLDNVWARMRTSLESDNFLTICLQDFDTFPKIPQSNCGKTASRIAGS